MTVVIKKQEELEALIVDGAITIDGNLYIECDVSIDADINARDINAGDIKAWDINARDINAGDIKAWDINARYIDARNIDADINARDINAGDIKARYIDARNISYYAGCFAYNNIECTSIKGRREKCKHFCLDGEVTIKKEKKRVTLELTNEQLDKIKSIIGEINV